MPYEGINDPDLPSNVKAATKAKRTQWVSTWNNAFARCEREGGKDCEGRAFRIANAALKESEREMQYKCECLKCGHLMESDEHCRDIKCPECGGTMRRAERPGPGQESADDELAHLEEVAHKTEDGQRFPAAAYAYVPDPEKPSTWKIRLWESLDKKMTIRQLGRAAAAFSPGGFRGQRVQIPSGDVAEVKAKIRAAYRRLDVESDDIPVGLRESGKKIPHWIKEREPMERLLAKSCLPLEEGAYDEKRGELLVTIIRPGFNKSKSKYYSTNAIEETGSIFNGAKMFVNHQTKQEAAARPEGDFRDWAGNLGDTFVAPDGSLKAPAKIVDPATKEKLALASAQGLLHETGASIRALGTGIKKVIKGHKTLWVERFTGRRSVDIVTFAGAGGRVDLFEAGVELLESDEGDENDVDLIDAERLLERRPDVVELIETAAVAKFQEEEGSNMPTDDLAAVQKKLDEAEKSAKELKETSDKEIADLTKERDELKVLAQKGQRAEVRVKVQEAVTKTDLPEPSKKRLVQQFDAVESDEKLDEAIDEAVKAEKDYLAELAKAGEVKDLGESKKEEEDGKKALRETLTVSYQRKGKTLEEAQALAGAEVSRR